MVTLDDEASVDSTAFGEQLRRTRESAGLRIEDIVAETKVSKSILEALEDGNFKFLPEKVFCRSFVAQYARTIGIDETPLLSSFDQAWEQFTISSGIHTEFEMVAEDLGRSIRWRFWIPIATGILILLIAAAVILRGSTIPGEGLAPDPRRSGVREAAMAMAKGPTAIPTPQLNPTSQTGVAIEDSMVRMLVEVDIGEECWIHYRDRDGMTGQQLLEDGEQLALELAGPIKLTIGNAGAVHLTIDGQRYDDLGLPGQVIHTEVADFGFTPHRSTETTEQ